MDQALQACLLAAGGIILHKTGTSGLALAASAAMIPAQSCVQAMRIHSTGCALPKISGTLHFPKK